MHEHPQLAPEAAVHSREAALVLHPLSNAVRLLDDSRAAARRAVSKQVGTVFLGTQSSGCLQLAHEMLPCGTQRSHINASRVAKKSPLHLCLVYKEIELMNDAC